MALFTILRRTASSVIPRSIRSIATQRNYSSAILKNTNSCFSQRIIQRTFSPILNFSSLSTQSNSDYKLVKILDSEIESAEEEGNIELDEIPDWFPFEIKDDPGKQTIILRSNYEGEDIKVVVHVPGPVEEGEGEEEEEEDGDNNESNEESVQTCISMIVSVAKGRNEPCLEFGCTVYRDEIIIDSLSVKDPDTSEDDLAYEGPDFSDLDENLQNAFHKYLEVRGIKPSTTNFLYEYMSNKESKEYLNWLKNVKYFVEK